MPQKPPAPHPHATPATIDPVQLILLLRVCAPTPAMSVLLPFYRQSATGLAPDETKAGNCNRRLCAAIIATNQPARRTAGSRVQEHTAVTTTAQVRPLLWRDRVCSPCEWLAARGAPLGTESGTKRRACAQPQHMPTRQQLRAVASAKGNDVISAAQNRCCSQQCMAHACVRATIVREGECSASKHIAAVSGVGTCYNCHPAV